MEFKKVKNNTGRMTYLSLENSEFIMEEDCTNNKRINQLISEYNCYVLYPCEASTNLHTEKIPTDKNNLIFIIDATWPCSRKLMKLSKNLQSLPRLSFNTTQESIYEIKKQPKKFHLSTIESTKVVLECLKDEKISKEKLNRFLDPFKKMIEYQKSCENDPNRTGYRRKIINLER